MKTKRWTLLAATGVTVLISSMAFAAGTDTGSTAGTGTLGGKSTMSATVGTDTGGTGGTTTGANAGANAGVNAGAKLGAAAPATPGTAGTGAGTSAGGMSSSHMSTEGAANTSGMNSTDADKGAARAEDGTSAQISGKTNTHTRTSMKHHKVAKPATTDSSGS
ncbi:hypothetical protein [Paraburkholderia azotifigens]|uniref:Late embryogenesis abundant protein n=1 Tax=Paraburkholderia azotifigens TaxID=2057004 RepID=A0A5C6VL60_9BURK|nr:hypothetical protein [Paraburkholderia azotifigens]TXC85534.1 hypothetical protein FRZ40_17085 [Paraburkholderia azotifigens]